MRLGLYFGNRPQLWLGLQDQHDIERMERQRAGGTDRQVRRPKLPA